MPYLVDRAEEVFSPAASAAAEAREFVRAAGGRWNLKVDDAVLVVSELVTNVIRHVGSPIQLSLERKGTNLLIEVTDTSDIPACLRKAAPEACTGRGLSIVEEVAVAWGSHERPAGGKTVWAQLEL
jgi:anti-sigma regulatory factor (Ser/Thr protein kinase)